MGYSQTLAISPAFVASDTIIAANDTVDNFVNPAPFQKIKEIKIVSEIYPHSTFRFKFDLNVPLGIAHGQIYRNGIAVGIDHATPGFGWTTFSEDLIFTNLKLLDTFELWVYCSNANGQCRNFRVHGNQTILYNTLE
jgi:hypothetical protein